MHFKNLIPQNCLTAFIGGGGKTSLIDIISQELLDEGLPVLVTVTTRLGRNQLPFLSRVEAQNLEEAEKAAARVMAKEHLLLAGPYQSDDKLSGLPRPWLQQIQTTWADKLTIVVEADGSASRPLKLHRPNEPVLPYGSNFLLAVLGLSILINPWKIAVHKPELLEERFSQFCRTDILSPEQIAEIISTSWPKSDLIFLNQFDCLTESSIPKAEKLIDILLKNKYKIAFGSIQQKTFTLC
jgi:probable selenium-dependent hydroxylase accessory protein YqeC